MDFNSIENYVVGLRKLQVIIGKMKKEKIKEKINHF